jgi:hypothetical protein
MGRPTITYAGELSAMSAYGASFDREVGSEDAAPTDALIAGAKSRLREADAPRRQLGVGLPS